MSHFGHLILEERVHYQLHRRLSGCPGATKSAGKSPNRELNSDPMIIPAHSLITIQTMRVSVYIPGYFTGILASAYMFHNFAQSLAINDSITVK
jgi:hypothetical protein